ncbi:SPFH domain-containing protein [Brevibacterium sp. GP-SGM9]|uniref:SPFH domain-containing protein n=1 Tax=Brevibacterium sp. GP-SGM9 TaxID=3376990 RepID=UPI0039A57F9D
MSQNPGPPNSNQPGPPIRQPQPGQSGPGYGPPSGQPQPYDSTAGQGTPPGARSQGGPPRQTPAGPGQQANAPGLHRGGGNAPGGAPRIVSPEGERVRERPAGGFSGYFAIVAAVILLLIAVLLGALGFFLTFAQATLGVILMVIGIISFVASMFLFKGCTSVAPGHAVVLQLYGKYVGTVRQSGLRFVNPLYSKDQVSTRIRNHETSTLKVNDLDGNPIEIGAVVVWQVKDTAQAMFEVDDFEEFVAIQAETAVRHIANSYAYDSSDPNRMSLRDNADEITSKLSNEVAARVSAAGVTIIESRITQLAYAAEIARAMLQRQQATAVVAARQLIVEGAVGMVETAIAEIEGRNIVNLGQAERSDLVSNLMIVLCGDTAAQPTISTTRNQSSTG